MAQKQVHGVIFPEQMDLCYCAVYNTHGQIIQSVAEGIIVKASVHLQHEKIPIVGVAHLLKKRHNDPKQFSSHPSI